MVLDPIPQSLPVHFFGSRPQPPTSRSTFDVGLFRSTSSTYPRIPAVKQAKSYGWEHPRKIVSAHCRYIGLFCENIGLFCENVGLFCENVGLFCENVGLFCVDVGLYVFAKQPALFRCALWLYVRKTALRFRKTALCFRKTASALSLCPLALRSTFDNAFCVWRWCGGRWVGGP